MKTPLHSSDKYRFDLHRGGGASITRLADNASVFFQGDDASEVIADVEGVYSQVAPMYFDRFCSDYDDLMDETARNQRLMGDA